MPTKFLRYVLLFVAILALTSQACLRTGGWANTSASSTAMPSATATLSTTTSVTVTSTLPPTEEVVPFVPVTDMPTFAPTATSTPITIASSTPTACPIPTGQVSHDSVLINAAIAKLNLPFVQGKPYPVTNATQLLEYFSINLDTALVEVDSDCTTLQIPPQRVSGNIVPFWACNPTNRHFDGWRASNQPDGTVLDINHQQGFPTGGWLMEGISFAPNANGDPILAVPNACTTAACPIPTGQVSHDAILINEAIAKLNLPFVQGKPYPVTNASQLLDYFSITLESSVVEVDHDCTTIQIPPQKVSGSIVPFLACNPTDRHFDGWRSSNQPDGTVLDINHQQGFPTGSWLLEGVSFAPNANGSAINAVSGACQ